MLQVPVDKGDSARALLSEGYNFIANCCTRYQTDVFQTRLMLHKVLKLLRDKGSMELLSGEAPRRAAS
ncbi:MAG TPA: hypothetical protein VFK24_03580 [Gammaproteobacteria bacterium]|nr:hypothetical protein [Gammaproteobacteria bacterium]